ncbi:unnamed protein product [Pleuronectes platessa]|uniref:Uncharacterized protein n=1 Tax=Pleuronectes platessa TaxID=8262 RepID=A0A9N7VL97_PLEPL|nr:unnamed protein product [Pleuronectes platessa]
MAPGCTGPSHAVAGGPLQTESERLIKCLRKLMRPSVYACVRRLEKLRTPSSRDTDVTSPKRLKLPPVHSAPCSSWMCVTPKPCSLITACRLRHRGTGGGGGGGARRVQEPRQESAHRIHHLPNRAMLLRGLIRDECKVASSQPLSSTSVGSNSSHSDETFSSEAHYPNSAVCSVQGSHGRVMGSEEPGPEPTVRMKLINSQQQQTAEPRSDPGREQNDCDAE